MCVYRIGTGRAFPVLLQNPINFVQASSHFIEMILKLELVLSPYIIIQYNLGIFFSKVTHSKKDYEWFAIPVVSRIDFSCFEIS